ncbi:MAG: hypothetical protein EBU50_02565 [Opitutae bacterium]|nr:hypothetical protein [Opitutae bacterium]
MSQDNNEDNNRVKAKPLIVWIILIGLVALLVNYSAPPANSVQKLSVTEVLSLAQKALPLMTRLGSRPKVV